MLPARLDNIFNFFHHLITCTFKFHYPLFPSPNPTPQGGPMKRAKKRPRAEVREPISKLIAENRGRRFVLD